jgi:hypothetical protein
MWWALANAADGGQPSPRPVVHPDKPKTHRWAPVIVYSPEHHHYHLTYPPR